MCTKICLKDFHVTFYFISLSFCLHQKVPANEASLITLKHRRNKSARKHSNESIPTAITRGPVRTRRKGRRAGMRVTNAIRWSFEPDVSHFSLASHLSTKTLQFELES